MKSIALTAVLLFMAICLIGCGEEAVEQDPFEGAEAESEQPDEVVIKGEGEHITIIVDEIKMTNQIPPIFLESIQGDPPVLSENHTFLYIYFTILRIDDIYIRAPEEFPLYDEHGEQYLPVFAQIIGVTYTDPTDIRSPIYFAEGSTGSLLYQIPEQIDPVKYIFQYQYSTTADGEIEGSKQLEIPLSN